MILPPKKEPKKKQAAKNPAKRKLTKQVRTFIEEMANPLTKSATEAAIKAGSPPKCARATASRWLTNANISAEISERMNKAMAHSQVTHQEVLGHAVRQMRSSIDDVLNERGEFDLEKARETGGIDFIKKLRIKTVTNKDGDMETTHEIEMYSPQDGRRDAANYIGMEKAPMPTPRPFTDEELAKELFRRLVENRGWPEEDVIEGIKQRFPEIDIQIVIDSYQKSNPMNAE